MVGGNLLEEYPALGGLLFWGAVCLLKTLFMSLLTARQRFAKNVFANEEDKKDSKSKFVFDDPDVERVRRNHLNDLENVLPFFLLGLCYVLTNPSPFVALWHFRLFGGSRLLHTVTYQLGIQPFRALAFMIGLIVCFSMGIQVVLALA